MGLFRPEDLTRRFSSAQNSKASFLVRSPGKGRDLHARMGTPWLPPSISPLGHPSCAHPPGGAGSARPQCRHNAYPNVSSIWPPASRQLVRDHDALGFAPGPYSRARRPRPSEKIASRVVSGYSPLGHRFALALPRRGGLRTPATTHWASHVHVPARPSGVRLRARWECNASTCTRPCHPGAETAPLRENRPARYPRAPGSPRKATSPRLIPREGRALHARGKDLRLTGASPY